MFDQKSFENVTAKKEITCIKDIENQMWKNNIKQGKRENKDFLNTANEDFTQIKTKSIQGFDHAPSTFNIFRDNLKVVNDRMHEEMCKNLPELNLNASESETDEDVLPLDFNTAMIGKENKIVIQAKPLTLEKKFDEDDFKKLRNPTAMSLNAYLESARRDPFKEDEGAVNIDPDINIREKFEKIKLPCDEARRLNNSFNAPIIEVKKKPSNRAPSHGKQYESDAGTASENEDARKKVPDYMKKGII